MSKKEKNKVTGTSLASFVRGQCACWTGVPDEECLGVDVYGEPFREPGKCWVMQGKPCKYFKESVLGPADYGCPHLCFVRRPAFEKRVRKQYRKIDHTVVGAEVRRCPDCGAVLRPKQRFCDKCSKRRRKDSYRRSRRKRKRRA